MKTDKHRHQERQQSSDNATDVESDSDIVSKSERKRQMHHLQELGEALIDLKHSALKELPLSEALYDAVQVTHSIKKREARRRQLQFIGKLMRKEEPETIQQITSTLEQLHKNKQRHSQQQHLIESWRDKIIHSEPNAVEEFIQQYPQADRQWLHQMARQYQSEQKRNRPPTASRKVFSYIRGFVELQAEQQPEQHTEQE